MRFLTILVIVLASLWGGYWYVGKRSVESSLSTWIEARQNEGWLAEYSELKTRGFPNRFDTRITALELADPETGLAFSFPHIDILTLSYTPNHIILDLPQDMTVASPVERITVANDQMRGSVVFQPDTTLAIDRTSFELLNLTMTSSEGWTASIADGSFATRQAAEAHTHDIYFNANKLVPPEALRRLLDPTGRLAEVFDGVELDMTATFDAPWDRFALERARPQPQLIEIKTFSANWGELTFQAAGELEVDASGRPSGKLDLRAVNWRDMLAIAAELGLVPTNLRPTIESMLEVLANASGNPQTLDAPLSFRRGTMYFAGLPIGPAPNLGIR